MQIVGELGQVRPTVLPSVPRIFEKVYAVASRLVPPERQEEVAQAIHLDIKIQRARR